MAKCELTAGPASPQGGDEESKTVKSKAKTCQAVGLTLRWHNTSCRQRLRGAVDNLTRLRRCGEERTLWEKLTRLDSGIIVGTLK